MVLSGQGPRVIEEIQVFTQPQPFASIVLSSSQVRLRWLIDDLTPGHMTQRWRVRELECVVRRGRPVLSHLLTWKRRGL